VVRFGKSRDERRKPGGGRDSKDERPESSTPVLAEDAE